MKTFEKNQNPENQDKNKTNQTNQNQFDKSRTPESSLDPQKRPIDPSKQPVKEPGKQQPQIEPDSTSPEKHRNDPVALNKGDRNEKAENDADIRSNDSSIDTNPAGKTKDASVNRNDHKGTQPDTDRNKHTGDISRDNQQR
jgi:hypothetical protein